MRNQVILIAFLVLQFLTVPSKAFLGDLVGELAGEATRHAIKKAVGGSKQTDHQDGSDERAIGSGGDLEYLRSSDYGSHGQPLCTDSRGLSFHESSKLIETDIQRWLERDVVGLAVGKSIKFIPVAETKTVLDALERSEGGFQAYLLGSTRAIEVNRSQCNWFVFETPNANGTARPVLVTSSDLQDLAQRLIRPGAFQAPDYMLSAKPTNEVLEAEERRMTDLAWSMARTLEHKALVQDRIMASSDAWHSNPNSKKRLKKLFGKWKATKSGKWTHLDFGTDGILWLSNEGEKQPRHYFSYLEPSSGHTVIGLTDLNPTGAMALPIEWHGTSSFTSILFQGTYVKD